MPQRMCSTATGLPANPIRFQCRKYKMQREGGLILISVERDLPHRFCLRLFGASCPKKGNFHPHSAYTPHANLILACPFTDGWVGACYFGHFVTSLCASPDPVGWIHLTRDAFQPSIGSARSLPIQHGEGARHIAPTCLLLTGSRPTDVT